MDERERSLLENDFGLKMLEKDPSGLIKKIFETASNHRPKFSTIKLSLSNLSLVSLSYKSGLRRYATSPLVHAPSKNPSRIQKLKGNDYGFVKSRLLKSKSKSGTRLLLDFC